MRFAIYQRMHNEATVFHRTFVAYTARTDMAHADLLDETRWNAAPSSKCKFELMPIHWVEGVSGEKGWKKNEKQK